jgi:hypothetical protein
VLHELWDDPEDEGRFTFCLSGPRGDDARTKLSPAARLVWTVEAESHFDAMTRYYQHQGWGTYSSDQEWDHSSYGELGWEFEGRPVRGAESQAAMLTRQLRSSDDPLYVRLRELLQGFGVDMQAAVLAQLFPDDVDQEFGVIVTPGRAVFTFVLHYGRHGDLKAQVEAASISALNDISDRWQTSPYRRYVHEALMLSEDRDERGSGG